VSLLLAREFSDDERLAGAYQLCLWLMADPGASSLPGDAETFYTITLRRLLEDWRRIPPTWRARLREVLALAGEHELRPKVDNALR